MAAALGAEADVPKKFWKPSPSSSVDPKNEVLTPSKAVMYTPIRLDAAIGTPVGLNRMVFGPRAVKASMPVWSKYGVAPTPSHSNAAACGVTLPAIIGSNSTIDKLASRFWLNHLNRPGLGPAARVITMSNA